jgi:hypothetical protein
MLQVHELLKIENDPKKVEAILNDEERSDLKVYEDMMKKASARGERFIAVNSVPKILKNLLSLNGYVVCLDGDIYKIDWSCQETENSEGEFKQSIRLQDGSFVEIDGVTVKHTNGNGQILYDSTNRVAYNPENIDDVFTDIFRGQIPE